MRIGTSANGGPRSSQLAAVVSALVLSALGATACSSSGSSTGGADLGTSTVPLAMTASQITSPVSTTSASTLSTQASTTLTVSATRSSTAVSTTDVSTTELHTKAAPTPGSTGLPSYLADLTIGVAEVVKFAPGATSIAVDGAVIRGERDVYHVGAGQGQTLELSISSLENNAVFDLFAPDGTLLAREVMASNTLLPADGDYIIVVGGTRGTATYKLGISIPA